MEDPSFAVIGAAIDVHREWGPGVLEAAYARGLEMELDDLGIQYQRELPLPLWYKDRPTGLSFRADFFVIPSLMLELKALPSLGQRERFQLTHYLKSSRTPSGLLLNFGQDRLQVQRVDWHGP